MGRALLANLDAQAQVIGRYELHVYAQKSIKTLEELREILSDIRTFGYAAEVDDRFRGFKSIVVPTYKQCIGRLNT